MKRDLFVFAGQSNMMGAAVFPPKKEVILKSSTEYKHKYKRLGSSVGVFTSSVYPVGEFSYADIEIAYKSDMINADGKSMLSDYANNTYFCPAMSNLKSEEDRSQYPFSVFSEATAKSGATLAPFLAELWEKEGRSCSYAHIAKGGVNISYYFTDGMVSEYKSRAEKYNLENASNIKTVIPDGERMTGAAEYFFQKCTDFFADSSLQYQSDITENKCFFWLQGESDANDTSAEYEIKLDILWKNLKSIGFTHFFCIRVDFFGNENISNVMKAQERFIARHRDAYMLTRAASYFTYEGFCEDEFFLTPPGEEYEFCRDSFFGFKNQHINEKGFSVIARHGIENLKRVLIENKEPITETENVRALSDIRASE